MFNIFRMLFLSSIECHWNKYGLKKWWNQWTRNCRIHGKQCFKIGDQNRALPFLLPVEIIKDSLWKWKSCIRWLKPLFQLLHPVVEGHYLEMNKTNNDIYTTKTETRQLLYHHTAYWGIVHHQTLCCRKDVVDNEKSFLSLITCITHYLRQSSTQIFYFFLICLL